MSQNLGEPQRQKRTPTATKLFWIFGLRKFLLKQRTPTAKKQLFKNFAAICGAAQNFKIAPKNVQNLFVFWEEGEPQQQKRDLPLGLYFFWSFFYPWFLQKKWLLVILISPLFLPKIGEPQRQQKIFFRRLVTWQNWTEHNPPQLTGRRAWVEVCRAALGFTVAPLHPLAISSCCERPEDPKCQYKICRWGSPGL